MLNLTTHAENAAVHASLKAIARGLQDRAGMHGAVAKAMEMEVKDHLVRNYTHRNRHGDFWQRVHDSIRSSANDGMATVALVEPGIGLRYHGGDVFPGRNPAACGSNHGNLTRTLAVPADKVPVVGGRQLPPAQSGLLAFIRAVARGGETVGYLVEGVEKTATRGKHKGRTIVTAKPGGSLLYTLRTVTRHHGDKNILPAGSHLSAAATAAARDFVDGFEA